MEYNIDFSELINSVNSKAEDIYTFEDIISLEDSKDRGIFLGTIEDGTGVGVDSIIRYWNKMDNEKNIPVEERKPIKIYIDSCGGSLTDTLTIIDSIKMSKTPIWTINTGCAYSGGFFTTISGHKRFAYPHASFLFHEGSTSTGGTSSQFENYSAFYKKQLSQLKDITLKNTKISEDLYKEKQREDWWIDANEALELGIIDEIAKELI